MQKKTTFLRFLPPLFLLATSSLFLFHKRTMVLYPDPSGELFLHTISDMFNNGNSTSLYTIESNRISWQFELGGESTFPMAGLVIKKNRDDIYNIRWYTHLSIRCKGDQAKRLRAVLLTIDPEYTDLKNPISCRHYVHGFDVNDTMQTYYLPLSDFETPLWWFGIKEKKIDRKGLNGNSKSRVYAFELISDTLFEFGIEDNVQIESIKFEKSPIIYFLPSTILIFIYFLICFKCKMIKRKRDNSSIFTAKVNMKNIKNEEQKKVLNYINENYIHAELSLSSVAKHCAITEKKVSRLINEATGEFFRCYLNRLRINEARRLLRTSDRNVSEIAYKIGYNSPSQLNRVFQKYEKCSPKEYRKNNQV